MPTLLVGDRQQDAVRRAVAAHMECLALALEDGDASKLEREDLEQLRALPSNVREAPPSGR